MITLADAETSLLDSMLRAAIAGPIAPTIARAVSECLVKWAVGDPSNLLVSGIATGLVGVGTINPASTKWSVVADQTAAFAAASPFLEGPTGRMMVGALALWVADLFSTSAQYQGTSATVGVGNDVSFFSVINTTPLIYLLASKLGGPSSFPVARGFAAAIAAVLTPAVGTGLVIGSGSGATITGATTSVVI